MLKETCFNASFLSKPVTQCSRRRTIWDGRLGSPIYYHPVGLSIKGYLPASFRAFLLNFQGLIDIVSTAYF